MEEKKKSLTQTRQKLVDMFLDILKSDEPLKWTSGWNSNRPQNAITDKEYRGINRMILIIQSMYEGYSDPRWCTFKQANDKGYRIKKGAKSTPVEFWSLYDKKTKKTLSYSEANKLETENPEYYAENVILMSKSYYVFNAEQIDGIPELEKAEDLILPEELEQFIDNIKKEMDISVVYGGNQAYYNVIKDEVHMPETNMFEGINEYYSTLLHELGHATGKDTRLNRNLSGTFGSENYAKEELRAEIASCFLTNDLGFNNEDDNEHNKNHAAYVKSWIRIVENSPMELMSAIKDAEIISGYLKEKGNYSEIFEKKNVLEENKLTKNSIIDKSAVIEHNQSKNILGNREVASAYENIMKELKIIRSIMENPMNTGKTMAHMVSEVTDKYSTKELIEYVTKEIYKGDEHIFRDKIIGDILNYKISENIPGNPVTEIDKKMQNEINEITESEGEAWAAKVHNILDKYNIEEICDYAVNVLYLGSEATIRDVFEKDIFNDEIFRSRIRNDIMYTDFKKYYENDVYNIMSLDEIQINDNIGKDYYAIDTNGKLYEAKYSSDFKSMFYKIPSEIKIVGYLLKNEIENVPVMESKSINIDNKSDLIRPEEKQELKKIDNTQYKYAILQIPLENPAGYNPKNYIDLETLRKNGDEPTGNDYEIIYIESTKEKPDLEKIYKRFNSGEVVPVNYYGTSVSMSDVIVTCDNNSNMEAYYCDRFGFKKLDTSFLTDKIINNVKNNVDIRIEYEKLVNANITSGITGEELERIALIDKEYKSVFNMADRRKEGNTKVDLPFPDVKEVAEEITGYNIDRNIEESDCKNITDKERSEKIIHQRMMLGNAR